MAARNHLYVINDQRIKKDIGAQLIQCVHPTVVLTRSHVHMELMQENVKKQHFVDQKEQIWMASHALEYAPQPA
jgi:hypothetical protein